MTNSLILTESLDCAKLDKNSVEVYSANINNKLFVVDTDEPDD